MIDQINYFGDAWWNYFIPLVIQNTLFLAIIYGALLYLKKMPARGRYSIALLGLVKLLIPAFIPLSLLAVEQSGRINQIISLPVVSVSAAPVISGPQAAISPTATVMIIWTVVMTIMLLLPLIGLLRVRYRLHSAELIDTKAGTGSRPIGIYRTDCITLPMTIGIFTKRIYVPLMWDSWSRTDREMAIRHEMTHINRRDGLISGLQLIVQAIYFFHPLVWLLNRKINELREMVCDESARDDKPEGAILYSRFLVSVAENMVQAQVDYPTANSLLKKKKELLNRIQYLLEDKMETTKRFMGLILPAVIILAVLLSWNCAGLANKPEAIPEDDVLARIMAGEDPDSLPEVKFIPYDEPPVPIGGYGEIQKNIIYPKVAQEAGIEGTVIVQVFVDKTGTVTETKVIKSIPDTGLDEAAIAALKKTTFKPAQQRDKEVGVWISVPVNFKLKGGDKVASTPPKSQKKMKFIPYDEPPVPVDGYAAIQKNVIYPEAAQKAGIEGTVIVQAFVDVNGEVDEAVILRGIPDSGLNEAAIAAIKKVQFTPARQKNKTVGVWVSIPVAFALNNKNLKTEVDETQLELKKLQFETQQAAQQIDRLKEEIKAKRVEIEKIESEKLKNAARKDLEIKLKDLQLYELNLKHKQAEIEAAEQK